MKSVLLIIAATIVLLSGGEAPFAADMEGLMMLGGRMVMVEGGKPGTPLDHQMSLGNGSTLSPDGTVRTQEGNQIHLQNGDSIMPDGHIMRGGKPKPMEH